MVLMKQDQLSKAEGQFKRMDFNVRQDWKGRKGTTSELTEPAPAQFTADTIHIDLREKTTFGRFACAQHILTKAIYICVAL